MSRRSVINQISISISHLAKLVQLNEDIILTVEGYSLLPWLNPGRSHKQQGIDLSTTLVA